MIDRKQGGSIVDFKYLFNNRLPEKYYLLCEQGCFGPDDEGHGPGVGASSGKNHHYSDVIMGTMASQITSLAIVYSTVYSGADQSSASLAFVCGEFTGDRRIHRTNGQ